MSSSLTVFSKIFFLTSTWCSYF